MKIAFKRPLDLHTHGGEISVGGTRAGDPLEVLARLEIKSAAGKRVQASRTYKEGTVFRVDAAGVEVPMSREEMLRDVADGGGRVYAESITWEIDDGVIGRIFVRQASLEAFDLSSETGIVRRLGEPRGKERSGANLLYHYPDRGLMIAWDTKKQRLDVVAVGSYTWNERMLTARDFLRQLMEAASVLEANAWQEPPRADESRHCRYLRLTAFARALGFASIAEVAEGRFLEDERSAVRDAVVRRLAQRREFPGEEPKIADRFARRAAYEELLRYRRNAEQLLRHNDGWLLCGSPVLLGEIAVTSAANAGVAGALEETETLLADLIDPDRQIFTERQLVERYGYPDVDLDALDAESY